MERQDLEAFIREFPEQIRAEKFQGYPKKAVKATPGKLEYYQLTYSLESHKTQLKATLWVPPHIDITFLPSYGEVIDFFGLSSETLAELKLSRERIEQDRRWIEKGVVQAVKPHSLLWPVTGEVEVTHELREKENYDFNQLSRAIFDLSIRPFILVAERYRRSLKTTG